MRGLVLAPMAATMVAGLAWGEATLPQMRTGLWQTTGQGQATISLPGQPASSPRQEPTIIRYICQTDATMAAGQKMLEGGGMPGCTVDIEGSDPNYTMALSCMNPSGQSGKITGTGTMTVSGDTGLHEQDSIVSNMGGMAMNMRQTSDSRWMGACPAGMAPGDFGMVENGAFEKRGNVLAAKPAG